MTYNEALQDFKNLFGYTTPDPNLAEWEKCYKTGTKPLHAFTVFSNLAAAEAFTGGEYDEFDETQTYEVYAGQTIAVVKDSSAEKNGIYEVKFTFDEDEHGANRFKLVKLLSEDDNVGGQITVLEKSVDNIPSTKPDTTFIYFVGVDTSTAVQHPDTLYFNPGIVYDASGGNLFQTSDMRLKDVKASLNPDLDELKTIDKVVFNWKQDKSHKDNIGVIAQSMEKVYPELVGTNPDTGYKMVNYTGLGVIALAAIDKLYDRIRELETKVAMLEAK